VSDLVPLEQAQQKCASAIHISVYLSDIEHGKLEELKTILLFSPGSRPVFLDFVAPTGEWVLLRAGRKFRVTPSRELVRGVEALLGESALRLAG
jgi:hypothetical protein